MWDEIHVGPDSMKPTEKILLSLRGWGVEYVHGLQDPDAAAPYRIAATAEQFSRLFDNGERMGPFTPAASC